MPTYKPTLMQSLYLKKGNAWYLDLSIPADTLVLLNGKPMRYDEYCAIRDEIVGSMKYKEFATIKKNMRGRK